MAPLPNPRFTRFWHEVDAQLASLGADDAWSSEILSRYDDGMSVHETALAIIEARGGWVLLGAGHGRTGIQWRGRRRGRRNRIRQNPKEILASAGIKWRRECPNNSRASMRLGAAKPPDILGLSP